MSRWAASASATGRAGTHAQTHAGGSLKIGTKTRDGERHNTRTQCDVVASGHFHNTIHRCTSTRPALAPAPLLEVVGQHHRLAPARADRGAEGEEELVRLDVRQGDGLGGLWLVGCRCVYCCCG